MENSKTIIEMCPQDIHRTMNIIDIIYIYIGNGYGYGMV